MYKTTDKLFQHLKKYIHSALWYKIHTLQMQVKFVFILLKLPVTVLYCIVVFSHACSIALGVAMSDIWLVCPPLWSRLRDRNNYWMNCTEIHGPNDFGDSLTFSSSATMRLTFVVLSEMARH